MILDSAYFLKRYREDLVVERLNSGESLTAAEIEDRLRPFMT